MSVSVHVADTVAPEKGWPLIHGTGTSPGRLGEQLFEGYLDERGYLWMPEPDLGVAKRQDYIIDAGQVRVACEVKAFNTEGVFNATGSKIGSRSMTEVLAPHRDDIKKSVRW